MNVREKIFDIAEENECEMCLIDGLDDAVIGTCGCVVVYSFRRILATFQSHGMSSDEAVEYYHYNVARLFPYADSPVIVVDDIEF